MSGNPVIDPPRGRPAGVAAVITVKDSPLLIIGRLIFTK